MPTGYAGEGMRFSKIQGKWLKAEKSRAFEYDGIDKKSAAFVVSFFRWYPDYFADLCRSPDAQYKLQFPQRLMIRTFARYRETFVTGSRGLTKTYTIVLAKMIEGLLYPGEIMLYTAPDQKQAAKLATQAFHQIEKDYPIIAKSWNIKNDRPEMFRIVTNYGSEFTMYSPRGDNSSQTIAEEIGQESPPFDMPKYEKDVRGTCRLERQVNQLPDRTHIDNKHSHITNACSRQNPAYNKYRHDALEAMVTSDNLFEGFVLDIPWEVSVLFNVRSINYMRDQRSKLSAEDWQREMCAHYTGSSENPVVPDEILARSKKIGVVEFEHCGDPEAIYIVAHDVSYADGRKNAKCADIVMKLTKFASVNRRDKYRKQVVFADNYPPPPTAYEQARRVRHLWEKFCLDGGETTYLLIDAQAYGTGVVEELMKPSTDGTKPLCTIDHSAFVDIEAPDALPVIYSMKSTRGGANPEGEMIEVAQNEFEKGYVELPTTNVLDGVDAYKAFHNIKDNNSDARIAEPYSNVALLCTQIANLETKISGVTRKEVRKSPAIQRDLWSALKYAIWLAVKLEAELSRQNYQRKSSWREVIEKRDLVSTGRHGVSLTDVRSHLLSLRKVGGR